MAIPKSNASLRDHNQGRENRHKMHGSTDSADFLRTNMKTRTSALPWRVQRTAPLRVLNGRDEALTLLLDEASSFSKIDF
jgi:hypothetical protein